MSRITDALIEELAHAAGLGDASIAVRSLCGGGCAQWDAMRNIYPASMIKTPIAIVLAREVQAGQRRLEDEVIVEPANVTPNDGPSPIVAGYRASLGELARLMIARSDNVATNVLIDVLDRERLTSTCRAMGLERTAVRRKLSGASPLLDDPQATGRNTHPAGDAARAFASIAAEDGAGLAWVYGALRAQIWNDKLSRGWDPADVFAHKTGDTDDTSHDGGILTLPDGRRFVVVVYTEVKSTPRHDAAFADFARALRATLTT